MLPASMVSLRRSPEQGERAECEATAAGAEPIMLTAQPAARTRRRWRKPTRATLLKSVAVVATCAMVSASGYLVWQHRQVEELQQRRAEFTAAAGQAVVTLMSIDGAKAQDDVQQIIDNSTGQFRDDFRNSADEFVAVAKESKSVTKASVKATAVESMTGDSAVVLVTAATTITNPAGANQQPRTWRVSVEVVRDGGQLKMSKVDFAP